MPYITDITRTKDDKVLEFRIETGLRDEMIRFIQQRIIHNLEATKRFLDLGGEAYKDICAGVYTYAVEEYGKILFLSRLKPRAPDNKIPIDYTNGKQGFLNHRHKIDLAWDALPDLCKLVSTGGFTESGTTQSGFTHDTTAKLETRLSIFFVDFNREDKFCSIVTPPDVKRDLLVNAVNEFLNFMKAQHYL